MCRGGVTPRPAEVCAANGPAYKWDATTATCGCADGYTKNTQTSLCECTAEVYDGSGKNPTPQCLTNSDNEYEYVYALDTACPAKLYRNNIEGSDPLVSYMCFVDGSFDSPESDAYQTACQKLGGYYHDNVNCVVCTAQNTVTQKKDEGYVCACADGVTDTDNNPTNGCDATTE